MASADLKNELLCSICLSIYTDPVTLSCGHNFCRVCIDRALDEQNWLRVYSCPECREQFWQRPALKRNIALHNVAERLRSTQRPQKEKITGICCTYCVDSPAPAVKSCLHCEASLCDKHLRVHSKGAEHVLMEPSTNLESRKCLVHRKILEYYCNEDDACICEFCCLAGYHQGHQVEILNEASEKKKEKLTNVLQKLITKREKTEERVQSLEERWRKAEVKASGEAEIVTALFIDIRRRVDELEKKLLSEISRQEEQVSLSLSDAIQKLNQKKDKLSTKMILIEELCSIDDPLTVLQGLDTGDFCDPEEEGGDEETREHDKTHDVDVITGMFHAGFSDIMSYLQTILPATPGKKRKHHHRDQPLLSHPQDLPVSGIEYENDNIIVMNENVGGRVTVAGDEGIYGKGPADILLDINTAANTILISDDLKTVICAKTKRYRPETAERFQNHQVISKGIFSSGRHYWDVKIIKSGLWRVGMCYPSMDRRGDHSYIGENNKSWCLWGGLCCNNDYSVRHDSKKLSLPQKITSDRFRICLDYEAGQISFFELCESINHLCTFTTTFTEPLHAALYVYDGSVKISGRAVAGTSGRT